MFRSNQEVLDQINNLCPSCGSRAEEAMSGGVRCSNWCGWKTNAFDFFEALESSKSQESEAGGIQVVRTVQPGRHQQFNRRTIQIGRDGEGREFRREWRDASRQALGFGTSADGLRQEFQHFEEGWGEWEEL